MKIYTDSNTFHCFGCGISGDIISMIEILFNLNFYDAIKKLNDDFCLNLDLGIKISDRKKIEFARRKHERKRLIKSKNDEEKKEYERYFDLIKEYDRLSENIKKYFPRNQDEPFNECFIEAAQNISYVNYLLECAEAEINENKKRTNKNSIL